MPDRMPECMSDRLPEKMPDEMSDRMAYDMLECELRCKKECQRKSQSVCRVKCPIEPKIYMPARMPERMPSEYLSDRMSVVGAIRRKYLFGSGRFHLLQWFHVVAPDLGLDVGAFGHLHRYYFIVGYRDGNLVARDEPDLLQVGCMNMLGDEARMRQGWLKGVHMGICIYII